MIEKDWSDQETKEFSDMYPYLSNNDLVIIFKRSVASIQHKANRLKIHKNPKVNKLIRSKVRSGEKSSSWKGGRKLSKKGYILILKKGYKGTDINGYIFEHRYVMEQFLGRHLNKDEVVHHINENKTDNRIENLKLMTNSEHTIFHNTGTKMSIETREKMRKSKLKRGGNLSEQNRISG